MNLPGDDEEAIATERETRRLQRAKAERDALSEEERRKAPELVEARDRLADLLDASRGRMVLHAPTMTIGRILAVWQAGAFACDLPFGGRGFAFEAATLEALEGEDVRELNAPVVEVAGEAGKPPHSFWVEPGEFVVLTQVQQAFVEALAGRLRQLVENAGRTAATARVDPADARALVRAVLTGAERALSS